MRTSSSLAALALPLALACTADHDVTPPGLAPPSCTMTYQTYRIDELRLPETNAEANLLGLDLDHRPSDNSAGVDNILGVSHVTMIALTTAWNVNPAIAGHLAAGRLQWALRLGQCADGAEIRVELVQAADGDGDGRLELLAAGLASVGTAGPRIATRDGAGMVPVGFLTDGQGDLATDAWQLGLGLASELTVDPDGALTGKVGVGIGRLTDLALAPIAAYASTALADPGGVGDYWRTQDRDRDGVISPTEVRAFFEAIAAPDLDLGDCDQLDCYLLDDQDRTNDHVSLGLGVHAVPVETE